MIDKIKGKCRVEIERENGNKYTFSDNNSIIDEDFWLGRIKELCATGTSNIKTLFPSHVLLEVESMGSPPPAGLTDETEDLEDENFSGNTSYSRQDYKNWITSLSQDQWAAIGALGSTGAGGYYSTSPVEDGSPLDFDSWWIHPEGDINFAYLNMIFQIFH